MKRKIVKIDESKCDGCGLCLPSCAEGAIKIVDGKARLISDKYCDGLGACLGECPRGAISIEEREAEPFDEEAVEAHLGSSCSGSDESLPCGCPGSMAREIDTCACHTETAPSEQCKSRGHASELRHWPVKFTLVPPAASFLKGADILVAADCVPFSYAGFHERFLRGRAIVAGCPKLDDAEAYVKRLAEIVREARPRALTVVHMEVPCCFGLSRVVSQAVQESGILVPILDIVIGIEGEIKREEIVA